MTGIGHEVDESLADLVADLRGSTPSNVAELITPDKRAIKNQIETRLKGVHSKILQSIESTLDSLKNYRKTMRAKIDAEIQKIESSLKLVERLDPELILRQGYSIISGKLAPGENVEITTEKQIASAEIKAVKERN